MDGVKMVKMMNLSEIEKFKENVTKTYKQATLHDLQLALRLNMAVRQQYDFRITVLESLIKEILNARAEKPDFKSKQFPD
jgi:hypothetical protein